MGFIDDIRKAGQEALEKAKGNDPDEARKAESRGGGS